MLRILSLPMIHYHNPATRASTIQADETPITMQRFANQVMTYLVKRGSNLKVLAIKSIWHVIRRGPKDRNGHLAKLLLFTQHNCRH
jgi:hypothetical protein